jgi:hypothetical protein
MLQSTRLERLSMAGPGTARRMQLRLAGSRRPCFPRSHPLRGRDAILPLTLLPALSFLLPLQPPPAFASHIPPPPAFPPVDVALPRASAATTLAYPSRLTAAIFPSCPESPPIFPSFRYIRPSPVTVPLLPHPINLNPPPPPTRPAPQASRLASAHGPSQVPGRGDPARLPQVPAAATAGSGCINKSRPESDRTARPDPGSVRARPGRSLPRASEFHHAYPPGVRPGETEPPPWSGAEGGGSRAGTHAAPRSHSALLRPPRRRRAGPALRRPCAAVPHGWDGRAADNPSRRRRRRLWNPQLAAWASAQPRRPFRPSCAHRAMSRGRAHHASADGGG